MEQEQLKPDVDNHTTGQVGKAIVPELEELKYNCEALHGICIALASCLEDHTDECFALAVDNVGDQIGSIERRLGRLMEQAMIEQKKWKER